MSSDAAPNERSNLARLVIAQALAGANATVIFATGSVLGDMLAGDKSLATLPVTMLIAGSAAATLPVGALAHRYGRRVAFLFGTGCGVLAGLFGAFAILTGSFALYCLGTFCGGAYMAVSVSFRFAAADCVPDARRARALSFVMAGGLLAGVVGAQLVTFTMNLWPPYVFVATLLAQAGVAVLAALVLVGIRLPKPVTDQTSGGRPLSEIVRQPRLIAAVIAGVASYFVMNWLMTSAPLAMRLCGLSQADANLGIQWHVIAMYAPSFVTGRIITRFGASRVVSAGLVLSAGAALIGLSGMSVVNFWASLVVLGLGWNFGFVGASAMVLDCYRPEEKARVQSMNDFAVFGSMVVGSALSGGLLNSYGWQIVCALSLTPLAFAALTLWLGRTRSAPVVA